MYFNKVAIVFKLNNKIKISMSYITNFKPASFLDFKSFKSFKLSKSKNNKKIISKNFFLFLLLLKYINKNNNLNVSIFVKPFYKKFITLLRAPYRHKLARHQFMLSRYYLAYTFTINSKHIFIKNCLELIYLLKRLKNFYVWFESNLVYLHRSQISFNFFFENNFIFNKF